VTCRRWRSGAQFVFCHLGIQRPVKFALVGAFGIVIQLLILEMLTTIGLDYFWATGVAVEAAVLHNFLWHQRFTWRDRRAQTGMRLLRFHLSN
jgi:putative flippase GtrA